MNHAGSLSIEGNATRDAEIRFTASGMAVCSFTLAHNRSRKDKRTDEWIEEASFVDITTFAQLAENVAESITKGCGVVVIGRIKQESWEDRETGQKRSKLAVIADTVGLSLRNATATASRNERHGPPPERRDAAPAYAPDEEPF